MTFPPRPYDVCCLSDIVSVTCYTGIRSQSKPHDIMHEVYRAMKTLGYVSAVFTLDICISIYVNSVSEK